MLRVRVCPRMTTYVACASNLGTCCCATVRPTPRAMVVLRVSHAVTYATPSLCRPLPSILPPPLLEATTRTTILVGVRRLPDRHTRVLPVRREV